MRYSILGFNQEKAVKLGLSLKDLLLLQYIGDALASRRMKHTEDEDGNPYVWLQHNKIQQDLPILDIKERELNYSLNKLKELGLIQSKDVRESGVRGSRIYYALTELADSLKYSDDEETLPAKNCTQSEVLPAKNCTPDNLLNNNILNSNFTNVKLEQATPTPKPLIQTETSNDIATTTSNISNKKKKNRWEQCVDEINNFTDNEELRSVLTTYLKMRLEMTPIFRGQWLGLLNNLKKLSGDTATQIEIVQQSINRGYKGFFEVKQYKKYGGQDKRVFSEYGQVKSVHKNEEIVNVQF